MSGHLGGGGVNGLVFAPTADTLFRSETCASTWYSLIVDLNTGVLCDGRGCGQRPVVTTHGPLGRD